MTPLARGLLLLALYLVFVLLVAATASWVNPRIPDSISAFWRSCRFSLSAGASSGTRRSCPWITCC